MIVYEDWLKLEQIDVWIRILGGGQLIDFGYCPREREFTPAIFESSILKSVRAVCGTCGLSNNIHPDQHYLGYSVWVEMSDERTEELNALGLDAIEGQKKWVREKIKSQYDEVEIEVRQAMDKLRWLADEKRHLAEAICLLREV